MSLHLHLADNRFHIKTKDVRTRKRDVGQTGQHWKWQWSMAADTAEHFL